MSRAKTSLVVVDDEPSIRSSLSQILMETGYAVRSAADGFSALVEIRSEAPEILISDLNMPGMSGPELLAVVRRRFPRIHVVAMSGAFPGDEVPAGVAADAYFQKGCTFGTLLKILEVTSWPERTAFEPSAAAPPIWIARNGHNASGDPRVTIECPECLRSFPQVLSSETGATRETDCLGCGSLIRYAILPPAAPLAPMPLPHGHSSVTPLRRAMRTNLLREFC
jgi:CheY-like chemotaxis protein